MTALHMHGVQVTEKKNHNLQGGSFCHTWFSVRSSRQDNGIGQILGQDEIACFQSRPSSLKNITAMTGLVAMTTQCSFDR